MKSVQITTLALLGLAATVLTDPAGAKPGNGNGNRPTAEPTDEDVVTDRVRGNRPTADTVEEEEVEEFGGGNRPTDEFYIESGRQFDTLPPGIQRQVERGDGLPPGLQHQLEQRDGLPPGLQR